MLSLLVDLVCLSRLGVLEVHIRTESIQGSTILDIQPTPSSWAPATPGHLLAHSQAMPSSLNVTQDRDVSMIPLVTWDGG